MDVGQAMRNAELRSRSGAALYVLRDTHPNTPEPVIVSDREPQLGGRYNVMAMYRGGAREDWRGGVRAQASVDAVQQGPASLKIDLVREAARDNLDGIREDVEALLALASEVAVYDTKYLVSALGEALDSINDMLDDDD